MALDKCAATVWCYISRTYEFVANNIRIYRGNFDV